MSRYNLIFNPYRGSLMSHSSEVEKNLPHFESIDSSKIESQIKALLDRSARELDELLKSKPNQWDTLIIPIEKIQNRLQKAWSPISHLNSVRNTPELRDAYNACLPHLTEYYTKLGQNQVLFQCYKSLSESKSFKDLSRAQQQVIRLALRDFKLSGVALDESNQQRYSAIQQELTQLHAKFSENVLDATDQWHLDVDSESEVPGLPPYAISMGKNRAHARGQTGLRFGIDAPSYIALITYCENRKVRKEIYEAYTTRASDKGPLAHRFDNSSIMEKIIQLRYQLAELLNFNDYAALSLETKMAPSSQKVIEFLEKLAKQAKPIAEKEYQALKAFALEEEGIEDLKSWDIAYFSEKLKNKQFNISQTLLKPYFPLHKVLSGMFEIVGQLYGISFKEVKETSTWHPDVKLYQVYDEKAQLRGLFYIDLFAREQKRSGAWMDECQIRFKHENQLQYPVAYLTCNFTPPGNSEPALLTHDEVETLFHEFGHTLHHILTLVDDMDVSGINGVPWDAVELPSQFMENWCWQPESLKLISEHYETQAPLPTELLERLLAAKNFQSGMQLIRQIEFALFDMKLHKGYSNKKIEINDCLAQVRAQVAVVKVPDFNRFQHSFSHIFAGGYAAGYYSYLWAEILACDAFSKFAEEGILNPETGRSFLHHVLEQGGSQDPNELFEAFRGHQPRIEPLLKHRGIIK